MRKLGIFFVCFLILNGVIAGVLAIMGAVVYLHDHHPVLAALVGIFAATGFASVCCARMWK